MFCIIKVLIRAIAKSQFMTQINNKTFSKISYFIIKTLNQVSLMIRYNPMKKDYCIISGMT